MPIIMANDFYHRCSMISDVALTKEKQETCINAMKGVNEFNWQFKVTQKNGKKTPINDYESMVLGIEFKKIR